MSPGERLALVDRDDPDLPIAAQCRLLKVARSTLYYQPTPMRPDDLALMRRMDERYTKWPFYGSRRMVAALRQDGWIVNRKRVRRLMRVMGLEAIYQKPNTSKGHPDHWFIHICWGDCRSTDRTRSVSAGRIIPTCAG
jgi:putative transposase